MIQLEITEADKEALHYERFHHPHPRVQLKMEVVWLRSQGESHQRIAQLARVHVNTVTAYVQEYAEGGVEKLKEVRFHRPHSELVEHQATLEAAFRQSPPATIAEAAVRIEELTGIKRSPTQVRVFLTKMGLKRRKAGVVPSKADPQEQEAFKKKS